MAEDVTASHRQRSWGTVRLRITVVAAVAVAVVLAVTAIGLVTVQRRVLTEQLDESLGADVDQLLAALPPGPIDGTVALAAGGDDDSVAQIVTLDGDVVAATPNIAGRAPIAAAPTATESATRSSIAGGDGPYRLVSRRVRGADGRELVVHVASPVDDIDESIRVLAVSLAVVVPLATALLAAVVFVLVGRTLRPVERIRREVDAIGPGDLDRRVPQPPGQDEIARLATTMNNMLERLDTANRRQQRFVADASHELRTPLARIRTELEVDLSHPETADGRATTRSVLDEIEHLQRLVDDLLVLARADADTTAPAGRPVDLDDIVLDEVRAAGLTGPTIDATGVSGAQVVGEAGALRRAVRNVLDNALRHATDSVTITLTESADDVTLTITDDGPGIPADRRDEIFERFTTLDDARTRGPNGTGLGLAITRDILRVHRGTITIDPDHRPGARLVITLPAAPAPAA